MPASPCRGARSSCCSFPLTLPAAPWSSTATTPPYRVGRPQAFSLSHACRALALSSSCVTRSLTFTVCYTLLGCRAYLVRWHFLVPLAVPARCAPASSWFWRMLAQVVLRFCTTLRSGYAALIPYVLSGCLGSWSSRLRTVGAPRHHFRSCPGINPSWRQLWRPAHRGDLSVICPLL